MNADADHSEAIAERVRAAAAAGTPLAIRGGDTKAFYGHPVDGEPLELAGHRGVLGYEPTELMLSARAGTPLADIERMLDEQGQMLAGEPPRFGGGATLGGAVAAGLSGPRRPFAGPVRDHVLGVRVVDGNGTIGRFGGEVIKNVAGYDVSRLLTGSLGTLGVLLEVSLKVLPRPETTRTVCLEVAAGQLHARVERALRAGTPVTGAAHDGGRAWLRIAGAASAVEAGVAEIGGDTPDDDDFWTGLRDQRLPFFTGAGAPLWRIALPPGMPAPDLPGPRLLDWAGQQCWLRTDAAAAHVREAAAAAGGHATHYGGGDEVAAFTPLEPALLRLHRRLKEAFDPAGILNPGRMYPGI